MGEDSWLEAAYEDQQSQVHPYQEVESMYDEDEYCDVCGDPADDETGIFIDPEIDEQRIAHSQCGVDQGWILA